MEEQKVIFLKGRKSVLRPLNKETDLQSCLRWINDQDVIQYVSAYLPSSTQDEEEWFNNLQKRKEDIVLGIETLVGEFIGVTGLHNINWKDRTASHGVIVGEKKYWGRGYGTDANMVLLDYAFNTLNLRRIYSSVIAFNERSLQYHLTCGYQIEGVQRKQAYKKGKYWDVIFLGVFEEEWLLASGEYQKK
ncbi:MAG: GNAT family N-acetyltransferase [Parcubacteria group bacterium]|nr:GNAT family N-acetyltransferase [Parcubacteria group bacterium]